MESKRDIFQKNPSMEYKSRCRKSLQMDHLIDMEEDMLVSGRMLRTISKVGSHLQA